MERIWLQLIESWRSQNLPIQRACREDDIRSFETRYKIALPPDMREYLLNVNGMTPYFPGDQDKEGFSFWPLERIRTLAEDNEAHDRRYSRLKDSEQLYPPATHECI